MYYGKTTTELIELRAQYEAKFGYDPDGDMELELGQDDYEDYIDALKESVATGKDIFETLGEKN